ncbi:HSP20-like chaperone [Canariomyces notabilis]|uniref:HSP20-like chaperone n=1 Tax=Canariomyces notabilis TaxID=2074819 RepID=A0AAN6TMA0_9PEZI|nr:HSP20-like chaperone [Canariomyces arenarius]
MSFFPRGFYSPDTSFTPLFRLLDEFDNYTNEVRNQEGGGSRHRRHQMRTFSPKFDVRETDTAYELHGELPGIDRENINIEFTDPQTIVIRGRVERAYTSGTPPAGLVEGGTQMSGAITEKGEGAENNNNHARKASVADEKAEEQAQSKEVTQHNGTNGGARQQEEKYKYWVQERSVGEFARTFSFPTRVDQDAVSANLNNGVLSLIVPKAKRHETRRIAIN